MESLPKILKTKLLGAKRIALLCIGSELRSDDAAGIIVAEKLNKKRKACRRIKVFIGHSAPENLTGEIRKFKPSHLVIVDAAEIKKSSGAAMVIQPNNIRGVSFCTHSLPLNILADYLNKEIGCKVIIIGIQPRSIEFGGKVSRVVRLKAEYIANILMNIARNKI